MGPMEAAAVARGRRMRGQARTVRRDAAGRRLPPRTPPAGAGGRFYPALGAYLWARDCNWWTVARLAAAGLADAPGGVVFTPQVPARLRGFVRLPTAG